MSQSHRKTFSTLCNWILCCGHDQPKRGLRPVKLISSRAQLPSRSAGPRQDLKRTETLWLSHQAGLAGGWALLGDTWGGQKSLPDCTASGKENCPAEICCLMDLGHPTLSPATLKRGSPGQVQRVGHCWQNTTFGQSAACPARAPLSPRVAGQLWAPREENADGSNLSQGSCAPSCVLLQQHRWYSHSLKPQVLKPWTFKKIGYYACWEKTWEFF